LAGSIAANPRFDGLLVVVGIAFSRLQYGPPTPCCSLGFPKLIQVSEKQQNAGEPPLTAMV
jgi:hypothetical protein